MQYVSVGTIVPVKMQIFSMIHVFQLDGKSNFLAELVELSKVENISDTNVWHATAFTKIVQSLLSYVQLLL